MLVQDKEYYCLHCYGTLHKVFFGKNIDKFRCMTCNAIIDEGCIVCKKNEHCETEKKNECLLKD